MYRLFHSAHGDYYKENKHSILQTHNKSAYFHDIMPNRKSALTR